jgi:hypothetical protein
MLKGINDEGMARIATQLRIGQDIQIEQGDSSDSEPVTSTRAVSLGFQATYYSNGIAYVGGETFNEGVFIDAQTGEILPDQTNQDERVRAAVNANTENRGQTTNLGLPTTEDLTLIGKLLESSGMSGFTI